MIDYKYQLRRIFNKVNRVTSAHRHGQRVPRPRRLKMKMATVIDGPFKGRTVNIEIEAEDTLNGMCRCDLGGDKGTVLIRSKHLRKWISVESVELHKQPLHLYPEA